ncbi:MAG: hypothetical protein ACHP7H_00605 [Hyphomicrobiales bacterium]
MLHVGFRALFYGDLEHLPVTLIGRPGTAGVLRQAGGPKPGPDWTTLLVGCTCGELFARHPECLPQISDALLREHLQNKAGDEGDD